MLEMLKYLAFKIKVTKQVKLPKFHWKNNENFILSVGEVAVSVKIKISLNISGNPNIGFWGLMLKGLD